MSVHSFFNRRDPHWETEGPAARRERRNRARATLAFVAALTAVAAAAIAWSMQLGIAAVVGIGLVLPAG